MSETNYFRVDPHGRVLDWVVFQIDNCEVCGCEVEAPNAVRVQAQANELKRRGFVFSEKELPELGHCEYLGQATCPGCHAEEPPQLTRAERWAKAAGDATSALHDLQEIWDDVESWIDGAEEMGDAPEWMRQILELSIPEALETVEAAQDIEVEND